MAPAGIVLAAGASRRFGGVKQLAELRGRPLLAHAVETMLSVPALDPVIVVLGHAADEIASTIDFGSATVVVAAAWNDGQSASLQRGSELRARKPLASTSPSAEFCSSWRTTDRSPWRRPSRKWAKAIASTRSRISRCLRRLTTSGRRRRRS